MPRLLEMLDEALKLNRQAAFSAACCVDTTEIALKVQWDLLRAMRGEAQPTLAASSDANAAE